MRHEGELRWGTALVLRAAAAPWDKNGDSRDCPEQGQLVLAALVRGNGLQSLGMEACPREGGRVRYRALCVRRSCAAPNCSLF